MSGGLATGYSTEPSSDEANLSMSAPALALSGWAAAALAVAVARVVLSGRMEAVARACHELRGPLTAARLGLELSTRDGELSTARLAAIDLELARAALALEDLTRGRGPGCDVGRVDAVDLEQLFVASVET
jgi:signal transduction histidine kinase